MIKTTVVNFLHFKNRRNLIPNYKIWWQF